MTGFDAELLSAIISIIYDAALDPSLWPAAMQRVCDFAGGSSAVMFWHDIADSGSDALHSYNSDPHWTRLYNETYAQLNPMFPAATFQAVGSIMAATDHVPAPELRETRFYKEWLAPQGLTDALAVALERDATRAAFLTIQWHGRLIDGEARQRLALLVPHFLKAVAIGTSFPQPAV